MKLKIKKLIPELDLRYHSDGASGIDIPAAGKFLIGPGQTEVIPGCFCLEIPDGHEGQIRPRSSLSAEGLLVHFGTIDNDYRGQVHITISNPDNKCSFEIEKGERIAQLIISPVVKCDIEFVDELSKTERGEKGFGSTGK